MIYLYIYYNYKEEKENQNLFIQLKSINFIKPLNVCSCVFE